MKKFFTDTKYKDEDEKERDPEKGPFTDFRKEWIDGKCVSKPEPRKFKVDPDGPWYVSPPYYRDLERERKEIERKKAIRKEAEYYEGEKRRATRKEAEYYEGGDCVGRLDSFGITLKTAKSIAKVDEKLKSMHEALDKKEREIKMAKRKAKKEASPFRKGRATGVKSRGGQFVRLADGESVVFAPMVGLEDMVSADMHEYWDVEPAIYHPCIGRNCPGCLVDNESRFKAYLPVLVKSTGEPAIYPFTISVYNQLEALEDEIMEDDADADLKGFVVKVSRKGSMKATRYSVLGVGSRIDLTGAEIPDYIPQLGPTTEEDIWTLLEENGFDRDSFVETTETTEETATDGWGAV
jgi:hypothetical protein